MKCRFKDCAQELRVKKDVVPALWKHQTEVFCPRSNAVLFQAGAEDRPEGIDPGSLIASLYFEWLPQTKFQFVKLHLSRELCSEDKKIDKRVERWLKSKLVELCTTVGVDVP